MDSNAYKYLIRDIIETVPHVSDTLPIQLTKPDITVNNTAFRAVSFFLTQLVQDSSLTLPSILNQDDKLFFSILFRTIHKVFANLFDTTNSSPVLSSDKRNGTELMTFLCHAVTPKRITIYNENDALSYAMSCFIIESCMHVGWCPNAFENRAKRAAHLYFSLLKKSMYAATDAELSTILGYLVSAWLCSQKTEGIQDQRLEWEHSDLVHRYVWEIESEEREKRTHVTLYKTISPPVCIVMPQCRHMIPHPFYTLLCEGRSGLTIFSEEEQIKPIALIDRTPIERPRFMGERLDYTCSTKNGKKLTWTVVLQIVNKTIYRIDVIQPETEDIVLSHVEFRLENKTPLEQISENVFKGKNSVSTIIIEWMKNPFHLIYTGREEGISLFRSEGRTLYHNKPIEIITAWSVGKEMQPIDKTNLLGIFDIPVRKAETG